MCYGYKLRLLRTKISVPFEFVVTVVTDGADGARLLRVTGRMGGVCQILMSWWSHVEIG